MTTTQLPLCASRAKLDAKRSVTAAVDVHPRTTGFTSLGYKEIFGYYRERRRSEVCRPPLSQIEHRVEWTPDAIGATYGTARPPTANSLITAPSSAPRENLANALPPALPNQRPPLRVAGRASARTSAPQSRFNGQTGTAIGKEAPTTIPAHEHPQSRVDATSRNDSPTSETDSAG